MNLPLLDFTDLPAFDQINPEQIEPGIDLLIGQAKSALEQVTADQFPADWFEVSKILDVATEQLSRAWSSISHLNAVVDTPALRSAHNKALPKVTEFWTGLGSDERLFAKYAKMDASKLNPEQQQALKLALRNFILSGAELTGSAKSRFASIQERQAELSQKFSENVLDATDAWSYLATDSEMQGVPEDVRQATRDAAEKSGQTGHLLNLKMPCYLPIIQFCHDRQLRQRIYKAYVTRASDQVETDNLRFDNSELMLEILQLRQEEAQLLGFRHFADLSLATKMAQSAEDVIRFLRDLANRARPFALRDLAEMREFAEKHLHITDPQAWDWPYIGEQLKEAQYAYSESEVKIYFPQPRVIQGLFKIVETLFEVNIKPDQAAVWHPDVSFYRIERAGQLVGQFYLDPSARNGKRGGAWMDDVRARWLRPDNGQLQTPVAHLVCNFAQGVKGQPALLTHDDVITLFHEFGHGLHHMLTQVNERDVSGISGVEWDAVELPSQFMENFCWEWQVLRHLTAHAQTADPMPEALFKKMLAAKNFQSGLQTLRQIEFALFDMLLHSHPEDANPQQLLQEVRSEVSVIEAAAFNRMAHSFSHIFAGGYAAGYYSYKWAEVLSADAYAAFEETMLPDGSPNPLTGRLYRQCILEAGGSRPAMDSFKAFRGREPDLTALLRHQGMSSAGQTLNN